MVQLAIHCLVYIASHAPVLECAHHDSLPKGGIFKGFKSWASMRTLNRWRSFNKASGGKGF